MAFEELFVQLIYTLNNMEKFFQVLLGISTYNKAKRYVLHHPFVAAALVTIAVFSAIPMMFFLGFIITTLAVALLCFFCIEGSLIAISGLIFIGVVLVISIIVGAILSGMAVFVWVLQKMGIRLRYKTAFPHSTHQNGKNHQNINEENSTHTE